MKICKYCATKYEDSAMKCPGCGSEEFYIVVEPNEANVKKKVRRTKFISLIRKAPRSLKSAFVVCLAVIIVLAGLNIGQLLSKSESISTSDTVTLGLRDLGELATQAAFYTNVQVSSSTRKLFNVNIPLTTNKYIYSYDGVIKAGIDFTKVDYEVDHDSLTIHVTIPEPKILGNEIDESSFRIYDQTSNIFNPLSITTLNNGLVKLKEESQKTAIDNGLLTAAEDNAMTLISSIFESVYPKYTVIFDLEGA